MTVKRKNENGEKLLSRLRAQAKKDISVAGTVQFRLDEVTMLRLMEAADRKKMPLGTLVRMWTVERLDEEFGSK